MYLTLSLRLLTQRFQQRSSVQAGQVYNPFLSVIHILAVVVGPYNMHKLCGFNFSWY